MSYMLLWQPLDCLQLYITVNSFAVSALTLLVGGIRKGKEEYLYSTIFYSFIDPEGMKAELAWLVGL